MSEMNKESRERWVAVGADGAEHLFVRCRWCQQPWQVQRVLRVSIEDDEVLRRLNAKSLQASFLVAMMLIFPVIVVCSVFLSWGLIQFPEPGFYTVVQVVLCTGLLVWAALQWNSQKFKEIRTIQNQILDHYETKDEDDPFLFLPPKSEYD